MKRPMRWLIAATALLAFVTGSSVSIPKPNGCQGLMLNLLTKSAYADGTFAALKYDADSDVANSITSVNPKTGACVLLWSR